MSEHLICGLGEVGTALLKVFNAHGTDPKIDDNDFTNAKLNRLRDEYKYLHVCFPWSEEFMYSVQQLKFSFNPQYVIIHSTVPVGTCAKLAAISSPVRGLHPNLHEGIMTFPKFLAGKYVTAELVNEFRRAGLKVILLDKSETAELGKILDTEYYRACIEFTKDAKIFCDQHEVPFHEVYTLFNQTYNEGYIKLGYPEFVRPILQAIPGDIGGHCVIPNSKLL